MKSPDEYAEAVDAILTAELPVYDLTARPVVLKHVAMQRQEPTPRFELSVDRVAACRWRLRAHRSGPIRLVAWLLGSPLGSLGTPLGSPLGSPLPPLGTPLGSPLGSLSVRPSLSYRSPPTTSSAA